MSFFSIIGIHNTIKIFKLLSSNIKISLICYKIEIMKIIYIYACIIALMALLYSCSKFSLNKSTITTEENSISEFVFNDIYAIVDEEVKATEDSSNSSTTNCPIISVNYIDTTTKQRNIVFDFGEGCISDDGRSRAGKIIVNVDGVFSASGTEVSISLDNYYVNNYKVEGQKTITNNSSSNSGSNQSFSMAVYKGKVSTPDGKTLSWDNSRNYEWVEGSNTPKLYLG